MSYTYIHSKHASIQFASHLPPPPNTRTHTEAHSSPGRYRSTVFVKCRRCLAHTQHGSRQFKIMEMWANHFYAQRQPENCSIHDLLCLPNLALLLSLVRGSSEDNEVCNHWRRCRGQVDNKWQYVRHSVVLSSGSIIREKCSATNNHYHFPHHLQPLHGGPGGESHAISHLPAQPLAEVCGWYLCNLATWRGVAAIVAHTLEPVVPQHTGHHQKGERGEIDLPGCAGDTQLRPTLHHGTQETNPHKRVHTLRLRPQRETKESLCTSWRESCL